MPRLFPQLIAEVGRKLAGELTSASVVQASARAENTVDDLSTMSVFAATGGVRVSMPDLVALRKTVLSTARKYGFPQKNRKDIQQCDAELAVVLRDTMDITPAEAESEGVWEYLACVLMPDIVIWRFQDASGNTSLERFLSGRRNNFYRLWWRAYVLAGHLKSDAALELLNFMGEDEIVQIMERPGLFGNLKVMRLYCSEFKKAVESGEISRRRSDVNREVHKRLLRKVAVVALESLDALTLCRELSDLIRKAQRALAS